MDKIFVTYSNELYAPTRDFAAKMAVKRGGFDRAVVYKPEDIDDEFKFMNELILSQKRGAGLWLWKPYSIYKALIEEAKEGDILFYGDAGSFFFRSCNPIIESMGQEEIWVSNIPLVEKQYTKEDAFNIMECNSEKNKDTAQVQANFLCLRKSNRSLRFVKEWLDYCSNYDLLADDSSIQKSMNCSDFIEHRNDQSILSLLSKKWSIKPHLDPSQYGLFPEKYHARGIMVSTGNKGEYKPCIALHRSKVINFFVVIRPLANVYLPHFIVKGLLK